jgi:hypothetical protein
VVLGSRNSAAQWLCLVAIVSGAFICNSEVILASSSSSSSSSSVYGASLEALGLLFTVLVMLCMSIQGMLVTKANEICEVPASTLNFYIASYGFCIGSVYQAVVTWPNARAWVVDPIEASHPTHPYLLSIGAFVLFGLNNALHNAVTWSVAAVFGTLHINLVNAARTALLFALSHVLFCPLVGVITLSSLLQDKQCITRTKLVGGVIVMTAVVYYQVLTARRKKIKEEEEKKKT